MLNTKPWPVQNFPASPIIRHHISCNGKCLECLNQTELSLGIEENRISQRWATCLYQKFGGIDQTVAMLHNSANQCGSSIIEFYNLLRGPVNWPIWTKAAWDPAVLPIHHFISWLTVKHWLLTEDKLSSSKSKEDRYSTAWGLDFGRCIPHSLLSASI